MTLPRPAATYLRSILALDARIVSASLAVAFDSGDEERNGLVAAVERPRAYGVARFANGLAWHGATGASAEHLADEIAPADAPLWQELDGVTCDDAGEVLAALDGYDDGDVWEMRRDEAVAA